MAVIDVYCKLSSQQHLQQLQQQHQQLQRHLLRKQTWMIGIQQIQGAEQVTSEGAPRMRGLRMTELPAL